MKLSIKEIKIEASVLSLHGKWKGKKVETMTYFIFLGSKITADADCSHYSKRHMLLGRKAMTNLDSLLKSRDGTASKGPYSQLVVKNTHIQYTHTHIVHTQGFSSSHIWM